MSRKLIILAIGIFFLFSLSALATETRVATMGNSGLYLKDDAGIFMYPGTLGMYKNMIIAEHYTNSDASTVGPFSYGRYRRVGIITPFWNSGTLAVFAGDGQESFMVSGSGVIRPTTRFLVGYGMNSGNAAIGFQVDFSGVRSESPGGVPQVGPLPTIFTSSTWGFALGLSTPMGDLNNLDFGFRIRVGNFENKTDTTATNNKIAESDGNTSICFVARDYYAMNDYVNLVPVVKFGISTQKDVSYVPDTSRFKNSITMLEGGLGIQTKPTEKSEIIGGFGYRSTKTRNRAFANSGADSADVEFTDAHIPFAFLGFEAMLKSWIHFRLGVEKTIDVTKSKQKGPAGGFSSAAPNRNESKQGGSSLDYAAGVGIHLGPMSLDGLVENTFWNEGPTVISGETTGIGLFPRLTFTYKWK